MKNTIKQSLLCLLFGLFVNSCQGTIKNESSPDVQLYDVYYQDIPFPMDKIECPQFPDRKIDITELGAVGDGMTNNTEAINKAIQEIAKQGGGRVVIPAGIWKSGPIRLLSNVNLHIEANGLVVFDTDPTSYPIIKTSFEGLNTHRCTSPISALDAQNIAITGEGVFDGSGDAWRFVKKDKLTSGQWRSLVSSGGIVNDKGDTWYPSEESKRGHDSSDSFNNPQNLNTDSEWEAIRHWLRPVMVSLVNCKGVLLEGVTFRNSPAWCIHPLSCENLIINRLNVFNPWYSQNGDGLDLESCKNALIVNNLFDVGDDAICIKSGKDQDGRDRNQPCQNVIIRNNTVLHGHGGFVVGSEMSGGVKNIYVSDCLFLGTDVGLRFKSNRGRGGVVENIWIQNINMINIPTEPLLFDLFYNGKSAMENLGETQEATIEIPPVTDETPSFRNIYIRNVTCEGAHRAMYFNGLPEMKIKDIHVEDVIISSTYGAELVQTEGTTFKNVQIHAQKGSKLTVKHSSQVVIDGKALPDSGTEAIIINE